MSPSNTTVNGSILHDHSITSYPSEEEDPYSSFYNFPSPYIHYEDGEILLQHLHDLYSQQQTTPNAASPPPREDQVLTDDSTAPAPTRKRASKSDRHTKIQTAQGPRDRRMRLSLQVARPFFDLQDMLGFDKASKTIDWLLKRSKTAIKELYSGNTDNADDESVPPENIKISTSAERKKSKSTPKQKKTRNRETSHKFAFDPSAKETREKARARARERTMEKRKLHESGLPTNGGENQLGFSNSLQDSENIFASSSFLEPPFYEQLQISDYDVHGETWQLCDDIDPF